jgi:O-antigen/teichoic acid export membrane protein
MPEQTERLTRGLPSTARRDLVRLVAAATLVSVVTVAAGWLLLPWVIPALFGAAYEDAVPLALVVVLGVLGVNVSSAGKLFALAAGRAGVRAAMAAVELVAVLGAVTVGARLDGLHGAAVGYAAALLVIALVWCGVALTLRSAPAAAAAGEP